MNIEDALRRFAEDNEKCFIHFANGETIYVTILEIGDGFVCIDDGASESIVNIDYIMRVRAVAKKSGKKEIKEISEKKGISKQIHDFFFVDEE